MSLFNKLILECPCNLDLVGHTLGIYALASSYKFQDTFYLHNSISAHAAGPPMNARLVAEVGLAVEVRRPRRRRAYKGSGSRRGVDAARQAES